MVTLDDACQHFGELLVLNGIGGEARLHISFQKAFKKFYGKIPLGHVPNFGQERIIQKTDIRLLGCGSESFPPGLFRNPEHIRLAIVISVFELFLQRVSIREISVFLMSSIIFFLKAIKSSGSSSPF